jgi:hypothetical protein
MKDLKNRYFTGLMSDVTTDVCDITGVCHCHQFTDDKREKVILKLKVGDNNDYKELEKFKEITHEEAVFLSRELRPE